ncbi:MAG: hypothetical protein FIA91_02680 [Geobacter sp.]|nr:hypothetical protein [Geobacter sp.]
MKIMKHVIWLIDAARRAATEDLMLDEKHGIDASCGINPFEENVIKRAFEINLQEEQIEEYLTELDTDTLLKLEALMYFGRDGGVLAEVEKYFAELDEDKEEIVRTIIEKRAAYPSYFERAISNLKKSGVNVENI